MAATRPDRLPPAGGGRQARGRRIVQGPLPGIRRRRRHPVRDRPVRAGRPRRRPGWRRRLAPRHGRTDRLRHKRLGHARPLPWLAPCILRPGGGSRRLGPAVLPAARERAGGRDRGSDTRPGRKERIAHGRRGTPKECDGRAPGLDRRLQRARPAGNPAWLGGRGGRRPVTLALQPGGGTGFGDFHAYFLAEGTSVDLGTLGGNESEALAVNRRGQVAGHSRLGGAKHAFFIPEPGHMVDLGGGTSIAHGVNDGGEVVGLAATPSGVPHAFLWTATDGMRDLGSLGAAASMALGINNRREVVGGSGRAFLWTERTGMVDLGTLGGRTSCANDVNDSGYIVGVSQTGETDRRGLPVTHAFLRLPDGTMQDLGTLGDVGRGGGGGGGEHSPAAAISDEVDGTLWIAGHSHDSDARIRAVVWAVRLA